MVRFMRIAFALVLLTVALAACGKADNDPGPGGVTVGEARALDEAAEMLEQRRMPPEALPPPSPAVGTASASATAAGWASSGP
jgi:hypothetical protein